MKKLFFSAICLLLIATGSVTNAQITFTNYTHLDGLPDDYICGGVAVDTNNNKWFGTAAGVAKYDNTSWTVYDTTDGLLDMHINCVAVDKDNNIWVGTIKGVNKFNGTTWTSYTIFDGLIDNDVSYIAGDLTGTMWFVTTIGVSKFDGTWHNYTTIDGLPSDYVTFVTVDSLNNKWFGTFGGGVSKYNNSVFTNFSTSDSLQDNNVFTIAIDHNYHKWIGTWYGMTEFDSGNVWVANYDSIQGLYNNYIRDIVVDSKGNIWIGMFADYNSDGGITRYDGNTMTSYTTTDGLVDKQVIRLAVDKDNAVWIATGLGVSKVVDESGIARNDQKISFAVYPTVADDQIQIVPVENSGSYQIDIFNSAGQYFYNGRFSGPQMIDISEFPCGCYFVRLISSDKINVTKIIVGR
jgi:ligand-binding sensor domain-containing protein